MFVPKLCQLLVAVMFIGICFLSITQAQPTNGLVGYWPFNGNANDSSGYGHNGTISGGVTLTTDRWGNPNHAYSFDGVDGIIAAESLAATTTGGEYNSVSFWLNWDGNSDEMPFSFDTGYDVMFFNGMFGFNTGNTDMVGTSTSGLANRWVHVVAKFFNGAVDTPNCELYIDGIQQILSGNSVFSATGSGNIYIGAWGSGPWRYWFHGSIDDIRIYSRALSQVEIDSLFHEDGWEPAILTSPNGGERWATNSVHDITWSGAAVDSLKIELSTDDGSTWSTLVASTPASSGSYSWLLAALPAYQCRVRISDVHNPLAADTSDNPFTITGLVAYYPFTGNADDSSGNGHDGTVYGTTLTSDRFGNTNSAYNFDGSNQIELGNWFNHNVFTISMWVNPAGSQNTYADLIDNNHTGGRSWTIQQDGGQINMMGFGAVTSPFHPGVYFPLSANSWQHLVAIKDTAEYRVYINGNEVISGPCGENVIYDGTQNLGLGRWGFGGRFWSGIIDDIRLYNRALSQVEIDLLYQEGGWSPAILTSPIGGEQWPTNSVHNITWSSPIVDSLMIELSINNGSTWSTIVASTPASTGSYSWLLPTLPANQCRVRLREINDSSNAVGSSCPFTITGLVAYYPFSGNANDSSGNGHDGTVFGSTLTTDRFRNANNAYSFDGVSSDIVVPGGGSLDVGGGQTFSIWFRLHTLGESPLVEYFWNGSYYAEHIWANAVWGTGANLVDDNNGNHIINTGNPPINVWHHLVLTYDNTSGTSSLYMDGSLRNQIMFGSFSPNTSLDLHFGNRVSLNPVVLDGDLDDIRIYNSALSASEIDSLYHEGGYLTNQYPFLSSWNMFSVPLTVADARKTVLFPMANSSAFAYTPSGYVARDTLRNGTGYWLKFSSAQDVGISGTLRTRDTIVVSAGWNMIGSISDSVFATTIQPIPPTILATSFYGYNGGYSTDTVLLPSKGYWVKANAPGRLVLSSESGLAKKSFSPSYATSRAATITMSDEVHAKQTLCVSSEALEQKELEYFELPPVPPAGIFDARFSTNRMLEAVKEGESKTIPIQISYAQYPLTISWDMKDQSVTATLVVGNREVPMTGTGSTTITDPEALISLKLGGQSPLPKEFALAQNFPNPFNPTTTIKYDLPKDSRVSLKLFNMLGQEVATLVNEDQKGGYKSVEWNARLTGQASSVASGVYFYRLDAGSFTSVKKLLLLK